MKVVIDTNVLLSAIYWRSKNYWIRLALQRGQLTMAVTTDILDEYEEVNRHFNHLKKLPFPKVSIVNEDEFRLVFEEKWGILDW